MSDFFNPMDCSLPGSSVRGIFQARILEWVAIAFSSEHLSRLFHVLVAPGGTHLVPESEKSPKHWKLGVEIQQQLENLEGEQRHLKCSLEQQQVLRTQNNTDELH